MELPCLKLEESFDTQFPKHFVNFIDKVFTERAKLKKVLKPEFEVIFCVALTISIEVGFRLKSTNYYTKGFDLKAIQELISLNDFRNPDNSSLRATLILPCLSDWEFVLISVPVFKTHDHAMYNVLATADDKELQCSSSLVIRCTDFTVSKRQGINMLKNLNELATTFTVEFTRLRNNACGKSGVNCYNIISLPDELKKLLFMKLKASDFVNLCATCNSLWESIKDENVWRHFLLRDFDSNANEEESSYNKYLTLVKQGGSTGGCILFPRPSRPSEISFDFNEHESIFHHYT